MHGRSDCHDWLRMELTDNNQLYNGSCFSNNYLYIVSNGFLMTGCERNRPKINVYYFRYANRSLNAHLYSEKCLNTAKYKITRQRVARRSWLFAENMPPSPLFTKIKIHTLLLLLFKFFSFYFWQLHLLSQCYPTLTFLTFKQFLKSKKLQGHIVVAHSSMTLSCSAKTGQNLHRVLNSRDR